MEAKNLPESHSKLHEQIFHMNHIQQSHSDHHLSWNIIIFKPKEIKLYSLHTVRS